MMPASRVASASGERLTEAIISPKVFVATQNEVGVTK